MLCRAYAKINLGLRIIRRRDDGYHDIATVFHRIDLYDELTITPTEGEIVISAAHSEVPSDKSNLCFQAINLFRRHTGIVKGADIAIRKLIPVGAGLGGGSSDAAATLKALPHLLETKCSDALLREIGLNIGSDVPYFLHLGSALAGGRGERLRYFELILPYWIVLVYPNIHVPTAWAYQEFARRGQYLQTVPKIWEDAPSSSEDFVDLLPQYLHNDFEQIVFEKFPVIGTIKDELLSQGALFALMSGSGSSVFGLFHDEKKARHCTAEMREKYFSSVTKPDFNPTTQS
jgi:4-diphosphocytidyl-2-C-methyl-D-erythritol kinase